MPRPLVERRLMEVAKRLGRAREELAVLDEQLAALAEAADEARIRALVSESPLAAKEHSDASRHAEAMRSAREALAAQVERLRRDQDELLDQLIPGSQ